MPSCFINALVRRFSKMVYSSVYRRAYREPLWDDYSKQEYVDKMQYRSDRRSIEHRHQPWYWESDNDEDDVEEIVDEEGDQRAGLPAREEKLDRRVPKQAWDDRKEAKHKDYSADKTVVLPQKLTFEDKDEDEKPIQLHAPSDKTYTIKPKERENERKHRKSLEHRPKQRSSSTSPERNKNTPARKKQSKPVPFLPYGWANEGPVDIWKTHNVLASQPEVYPAALHAQKRRQQEVKRKAQLREEAVKKKGVPVHFDADTAYPKTWWLTEYQRNYCKEEDVRRHFLR